MEIGTTLVVAHGIEGTPDRPEREERLVMTYLDAPVEPFVVRPLEPKTRLVEVPGSEIATQLARQDSGPEPRLRVERHTLGVQRTAVRADLTLILCSYRAARARAPAKGSAYEVASLVRCKVLDGGNCLIGDRGVEPLHEAQAAIRICGEAARRPDGECGAV